MSSTNISAKEAAILLAVIENNNGTLNVDWANVAAIAGLKNGNTASTRFSQIKKKLGLTGTTIKGAGANANHVTKPRTPDRPHASSGRRKDTPTKGATPTRVRRIKATAKSYKLDTIEEEDEEAVTDYEDGDKQTKGKADTKARDLMTASDNEKAELELSMVEQVARVDFTEDGDEMDSDGIVFKGDSPKTKTVTAGIAPKAQAESIFAEYIIAEYDDYAKDAIYEDDESATLKRILYT